MAKLTDKQSQFCLQYLTDLNLTAAAKRAGYSEKTAQRIGSENFSKPLIQERIQKLMAERSERVMVTADWVLTGIKELTEELRESDDPKAAYKGYELAGKHLKMFTDKTEVNTTGQDLTRYTDQELADMITRLTSGDDN